MESYLYWKLPGHGACPAVCLIYPVSLHWENWFSLSKQLSITNSYLARCRALWPLPLLHAGILSDLSFCRSHEWCHSLCEVVCASALLGLENDVALESTTTSGDSDRCSLHESSPVTQWAFSDASALESPLLCKVHTHNLVWHGFPTQEKCHTMHSRCC